MNQFPKCVECGSEMYYRFTEAGTPSVSHSLINLDPQHLFCTLRCAARHGVRRARNDAGVVSGGSRAALVVEDARRRQQVADRLAREKVKP